MTRILKGNIMFTKFIEAPLNKLSKKPEDIETIEELMDYFDEFDKAIFRVNKREAIIEGFKQGLKYSLLIVAGTVVVLAVTNPLKNK
jgi:hypothetical protein